MVSRGRPGHGSGTEHRRRTNAYILARRRGRDLYAWQFERDAADLFLTYCTNAVLARAADASLRQVAVPEAQSVGADYGLILLSDRPEAVRFAMMLLSPAGQAILDRHGFVAPGLRAR